MREMRDALNHFIKRTIRSPQINPRSIETRAHFNIDIGKAAKLEQNITLLFGNPLLLLIPVGLVSLAYILARPSTRAAGPLRRSFGRVQLLRSGLVAVMVMWVLGFALNDSGAAIPAVGATLAIPLVIAIALRTLEDERLAGPATTRASRLLR